MAASGAQEHVRDTKKQRRRLKIPKLGGRNSNGGELDFEDKASTRVILEGGRLQARANLNGGELAEGRSSEMKEVKKM